MIDLQCLHCRLPLPRGATGAFCCDGCRSVSMLLRDEGLERYYELRGGPSAPVMQPGARDRAWLDPLAAEVAAAAAIHRLTLDVQGLHCLPARRRADRRRPPADRRRAGRGREHLPPPFAELPRSLHRPGALVGLSISRSVSEGERREERIVEARMLGPQSPRTSGRGAAVSGPANEVSPHDIR